MSDLAEFLLRRIAEEEQWARAARRTVQPASPMSPGRLLTDCAVRRKIIALHEMSLTSEGRLAMLDGESGSCRAGRNEREYVCPTLRLLALRYADHVEFNPDWLVRGELASLARLVSAAG